MKTFLLAFGIASAAACATGAPPVPPEAAGAPAASAETARLGQLARSVTITRDDWGIPHIRARTDARAVFGLIYAQAEDDFNRIEMNVLNSLGRVAEADGQKEIFRDLRMRLHADPQRLKALYASSPDWLRALMDAWADGLNHYLATHPDTTAKVLKRFEPWMPLAFSEGSIGWDVEKVSLPGLEAFYGKRAPGDLAAAAPDTLLPEPGGSNGIAIAPARTAGGAALLLINPHTSFFFRTEAHVQSDEGLNAYGAITWGQFFVYQGFNERVAWMHTSSGVDAVDEYAETVTETAAGPTYRYGSEQRPMTARAVEIAYRTPAGMRNRTFTIYATHHGPIVREEKGKWISVSLMQEPVKALIQSYSRTKATSYEAFKQSIDLGTNSSNNTVYADADGTIAYFQAGFIPRRDPALDWTRPVDGSNPATDWKGLHPLSERPNLLNPPNGWIQNTNNAPWSAAGPNSPRQQDFPSYMDRAGENARGIHALRVLAKRNGFTLDSLIAAAHDSYLPAFDDLLPPLFAAHAQTRRSNPLRAKLAEPIAALKAWDRRWSVDSVPTALAVFWGEELARLARASGASDQRGIYAFLAGGASADQRLQALAAATDKLTADFGTWKTPWGEINRFQRLTGDIVHPFSDAGPSIPVGFTASIWGSLAAFGARPYQGSKKIYGTTGNSFVAVVELGKRVRARAVVAGGQSGDPKSPHFNDQAERYSKGQLRDVYFHPEDLKDHTTRQYHPGS
jgi:acyl-homoserine-lactone acylase